MKGLLYLFLVSGAIGGLPAFSITTQATTNPAETLPADCRQYLQVPFEPSKIIGNASQQGPDMESCDPEDAYYGIDSAKNPTEALACSLRNRGTLSPEAESLNGSAVLAMLFANGIGVTKNIDLARKFVCEAGGESFDVQMRLKQLSTPATTEPFDFCTGFGYGYMKDHCADIHNQIAEKKRHDAVTAKTNRWSPSQKKALQLLDTVKKPFFEAHAEKEIEALGSNRHELQDKELAALEDRFTRNLAFLPVQTGKQYTLKDLQAADAELNKVYRDTIALAAQKSQRGITSINPEGIRETERLWLRYRDAWTQLGVASAPQTSAEHWKTWVTKQRIQQMQELQNRLAALEEHSQK